MTLIFAHRGYVNKNSPENSLASLQSAFKANFQAIEFDIWFVDGNFVINHDQPKKSQIQNLPSLQEYFCHKNHFVYWLDFKNLNQKNIDEALPKLAKIISDSKIKLNQIYFAPFITNYKISEIILKKFRQTFGLKSNLVAVCEDLKNFSDIENLRNFLAKNNIKFLSIFHQLIDQTLVKILPKTTLFAWTVNDLEILQNLENIGVKNFASDKITPKIYQK